jgi:hypothetical protein
MMKRIDSPFIALLKQAEARGKRRRNRSRRGGVQRVMDQKVYDTPSKVSAEEGEVMIDGPDGVAVSMTPDAAAETSDRLLEQAAIARGQEKPGPRRQAD